MKKVTLVVGTLIVITAAGIIACNSSTTPSAKQEGIAEVKGITTTAEMSKDQQIERGRYLVTVMMCNDCHSPKKMGPHGPVLDSSRLLSGHPADLKLAEYDAKTAGKWILFNDQATAFVGPWGTTYAANLTSDESGIGNWSEAQFIKALREGKSKGMDNTRPILPPMPWEMVRHANDEDLKAIFAYLKSTPPVHNVVPAPAPPAGVAKM